MGYETGAAKWWIGSLLFNPLSMYIHGGVWLWFLDILALLGADDFGDLVVQAFLIQLGWPSSVGNLFLHLVVGTTMGAISWYIGSTSYARSQGWR